MPGARHRSRHHRRKSLRYTILAASLLVVGYALIMAVIYWTGNRMDTQSAQETLGSLDGRFDPSVKLTWKDKTYGYRDHDITTILMIGVDEDELQPTSTTYRGSTQGDTLILLVADRANRTVTPIQLERDTMAEIDVCGVLGNPLGTKVTQLCLAQCFGNSIASRSKNTAAAVSRLLHGIPVDAYVVFDMASINEFNALMGGVTVTLEDDLSNLDPALKLGATVKLQGNQAELFVRSRSSVADGTNANRMKRQRAFLKGAVDLLHSKAALDESILTQLIDGLNDNYVTDMSKSTLINTVNRLAKYSFGEFKVPQGTYRLGEDGFREFYVDQDSLMEIVLNACFAPY